MAISETHDIGSFFVHALRVPKGTPILQTDGESYEVEEPWRIGRCVLLRVLPRWCVVVGRWGPPRSLEEMQEAENLRPADPLPVVTVENLREDFVPLEQAAAASDWSVRRF